MKDSIRRLNKARVHGIVIPCNTVHVFIEELRATTRVPILSIVEETVKICKKKKFRKVGLLASTKTVQGRLYAKELNKKNIQSVSLGTQVLRAETEAIAVASLLLL